MRGSLFRRVLGDAFETLPPQVRAIQSVDGRETWRGVATITRGTHFLVPLFAAATQLPSSRESVRTSVEFVATDAGEEWLRDFGGARMHSRYREWNGRLRRGSRDGAHRTHPRHASDRSEGARPLLCRRPQERRGRTV